MDEVKFGRYRLLSLIGEGAHATKCTAVLRAYGLPIDPGSVPLLARAAATCPAA